MTSKGKLSDRDRNTILKAAQIVDAWVKVQTSQGNTTDSSFLVREVESAAFSLRELLYQTR